MVSDNKGPYQFSSYQTDPGVSSNYYRPGSSGGDSKDDNKKGPPSGRRRLLRFGLRLLLIGLLVFGVSGLAVYLYFSYNLPSIAKVTDYRPPLTTQVLSDDLELIGEFHKQYRHLAPLDEIPPTVRQAFIASEDARFFEHRGIDYTGIMRALIKNIQAGSVRQGGSTITQQVAKSLLLTPERTLTRKIKEAILAFRIERHLTKEEILYLYLNQIYLGHGAYGVAAAARVYFNKDLNQLTLAEAALLAGMPTAPSRDNPFANPESARAKRATVLRKMEDLAFISSDARERAEQEPFVLNDDVKELNQQMSPYFTEHVRRYLLDRYGEEMLYTGGIKVYTTVSLPLQKSAQTAVRWNMHEVDRRHGYLGPLRKLDEAGIEEYKTNWQQAFEQAEALRNMLPARANTFYGKEGFRAEKLEALVVEVDDKKKRAKVLTKDDQGWIPFALMSWARKPNPEIASDVAKVKRISDALAVGDVVLVRLADISELPKDAGDDYKELKLFALTQKPKVQGAIVAADPRNGFVRTMVGGYDYKTSEFNRAVQAKRQPGSAFKPVIFAAAIDKGYTPATTILDAPVVYDDPLSNAIWRPKNYSGRFYGEMLFRSALIKSRNVVTIKILQDIGIDYIIDYAKKLGVESELTRDNTLALGSSVVTPVELNSAYLTFASGGVRRPLVFIKKIVDRDGRILERHTFDDPVVDLQSQIDVLRKEMLATKIEPIEEQVLDAEDSDEAGDDESRLLAEEADGEEESGRDIKYRTVRPGQVISEETAYMITHLMGEVVQFGTGFRIRALGRPAAGKTGTTNENIDAWFVGFTPNLVTTAWVGFDEKRSLGKLETGSRAASPMWLRFMQEALKDRPKLAFKVPGGITFAKIDPKTGRLATNATEKPILEPFKDGTQPTEQAEESGRTSDFFLEE